jgi:cytochrome c-type biogenesis protein CcmH
MLTVLCVAVALLSASTSQDQVRRIQERFIAPCCWHENLAIHRSPDAEAMRAEIREFVAQGKTEEQIVEFYVAKYGERILREPRGAFSLWLRIMPAVILLLGALLVAGYIVRQRRKSEAERIEPAVVENLPPLPDAEEQWR